MKYLNEIRIHQHILFQLVRQQIALRYRRTFLGYLWTLFNPLLMMSVTAVVFSSIFKMDLKTYAVFLFSGVIPFNLFANTISQCGQSLVSNEQLIKKIYVPKIFFPLAVSITMLIDNFLMFVSLFLIIVVIGGKITPALLGLGPAYILLFLFALGLALINTILSVYFRDLLHIIGILMQAFIFLSPVYYRPSNLSSKLHTLIEVNPLTQFIEMFREPIFNGNLPSLKCYVLSFIFAAISISIGTWFFKKHEQRVTFRM